MAWTGLKKPAGRLRWRRLGLAGCADLGYYWQSVNGHLTMMQRGPPGARLAGRCADARRRSRAGWRWPSASAALPSPNSSLPDNPSYHRYADLHRSAVVWNVVAAPAFSLTLKTWCFPVAGCVGYRGYFDEAEARAEAAQLAAAGPGDQRLRRAGLFHAGLDELGRRRSAAQHLHRLPRRRTGAAGVSRTGAPGGLCAGRHRVQRIVRHRRRAAGRAALAGRPGAPRQRRSPPGLCGI